MFDVDNLEVDLATQELGDEELEFYVDLAMNECQRWLEGLTRERFVDEEDFLYSLKHGTQLRKLLCHTRNCCSFPSKGYHSYCTLDSIQAHNECWVHSFLSICFGLKIPAHFLFRPTDLDCHLEDSDRHGGKLPCGFFEKVRRVITTVYALAVYNGGRLKGSGLSCDLAALHPLVGYHIWLCTSGLENPTASDPRVWRQEKQLQTTVTTLVTELVDFACASTSTPHCRSSSGFTGDYSEETSEMTSLDSMDPSVNDKVTKYLADLTETPPDDHLSDDILPAYSDYCGATLSTRSSSPADMEHARRARRGEEPFPTRSTGKNAGQVAHNPLQFIAPKGAGLAEQAKEQLKKAEELKKWKEENLKVAAQVDDFEEDWQSGLDLWKSRRRERSTSAHQKKDPTPTPQSQPAAAPLIRPFRGIGMFDEDSAAPVANADVSQPQVANTSQLQETKVEHRFVNEMHSEESNGPINTAAVKDNHDANNNNDHNEFGNGGTALYGDDIDGKQHRKNHSNSVRFNDVIEEPMRGRLAVKELSKLPAGAPTKRNEWAEEQADSGVDIREGTSPSRNSGSSLSPRSGTSDELSKDGSTSRKKDFASPTPHQRSAILIDQPPVHWKFQDVPKTVEEIDMTVLKRNSEKGFGFTVKGGKDRREPVVVDGVVLGSAADRAKLQVGDEVITINTQSVDGKYHSKINMMIREAIVLGEVELKVKRTHLKNEVKFSDKNPSQRSLSPRTKACFDDKRSMFTHEQPQYEEYKATTAPAASAGSSMDASSGGSSPFSTRKYRPGRIENFVPEVERSRSASPATDYRVVAHGRAEPGRILDFVPENERSDSENGSIKLSHGDRESQWRKEQEWILSQGDRPSSVASSSRTGSSRTSGSRSNYKPTQPVRNYDMNVMDRPAVDTRLTVNTSASQASGASSHVSPASSQLTNTSASTHENDIGDPTLTVNDNGEEVTSAPLVDHVSVQQSNNEFMTPNSGKFRNVHEPMTESHFPPVSDTLAPPPIQAPPPPLSPNPPPQPSPPMEARPKSHVKEHIVFSQEPLPWELTPENKRVPSLKHEQTNLTEISQITSREVEYPPTTIITTETKTIVVEETNRVLEPRRSLEPVRTVDSRPTRSPELNYLSLASQAQNQRADAAGRLLQNFNEHWMVQEAMEQRLTEQIGAAKRLAAGPRISQSPSPTSHYHNLPLAADRQPLTNRASLSPRPASTSNASPAYVQNSQRQQIPSREPALQSYSEHNGMPATHQQSKDQVVSVSGKQKCSHCSTELGRGAAMIIESLNLFYHVDCFCCYVCNASLGSGTIGADVRVRNGRLHCHSCYSNDEAGLKFSEV